MTPAKTLLSVVAAAALAVPASAVAAGADSRFDGTPWLAQTSGGAYVDFDLDRAPDHSTVTIDGTRAKVKTVREDGERFYRAFVTKSGLDAQKRYRVTIKVTPRRGKAFTYSKRLILHVARDRRPAGTVGA